MCVAICQSDTAKRKAASKETAEGSMVERWEFRKTVPYPYAAEKNTTNCGTL